MSRDASTDSTAAAAAGSVDLLVRGAVAVLTLNRPAKLNALTGSMAAQLAAAVARINDDRDLHAAVIVGAGRAFCVGSDIGELDTYDGPWDFGRRRDYGDILRDLRKPVVAAVNGFAFGGGLELSLACDIRLAADTASFAAPEIKLGWIGGSGMAAQLAYSVGAGNAALMVLTGDPIDADTARRWGLVSAVHPVAELADAALALAQTIAARAPIAAETAKINLRASRTMPLTEAIALERHLQTICFATQDAAEGRAAFAERRSPHFTGR